MSEPTTEQTPEVEQTQGDPAAPETEERPPRHVPVEELAKERERRKAAEERIAQMERANETALEKAQREAKEAQEAAAKAPVTAFREAAVKFGGISPEDAELFLTGSDLETLEKQAARLMDRTQETPTAPRADLTQGGKENGALALNGDPLLDDLKSKLGIA